MSAPTMEKVETVLHKQFRAALVGVDFGSLDLSRPMTELGVGSLETTEALAASMRELRVRVPLGDFDPAMNFNQLTAKLFEAGQQQHGDKKVAPKGPHWSEVTYDVFLDSADAAPTEITKFAQWRKSMVDDAVYPFEAPHLTPQKTEIRVRRTGAGELSLLNFSSYNYLGLSHHPDVIQAAKDALDAYGLGANSSPVAGGTMGVHVALEEALVAFWGLPNHGVSLFSSGYGANLGAISAFLKPGHVALVDQASHMSILEGVRLSGAQLRYFGHNDLADLEEKLKAAAEENTRVLVCFESIYSADGDFGLGAEIVALAKKYGAYTLIDEAHSMLMTGTHGRGVAEQQGILDKVDMLVTTFSKGFGGVGGAVYANQDITQYMNWYARCRMFSCALDPAVTGGLVKSLEIASGSDGDARRARLLKNADTLRGLLEPIVSIGESRSWIIPVIFGSEKKSVALSDWLQREGLDAGVLTYPAVPRNHSRLRLFVTSEHTEAQLQRVADILARAADRFEFRKRA